MTEGATTGSAANAHMQPAAQSEPPAERPATRRSGVSRTIVNFWLDATLMAAFVALCWISAVLQFVFPAGVDADAYRIWGGSPLDWRNAQFVVLCILALGIILHVMLHWSWVMGVITTRMLGRRPSRDNGTHTLIGVGLLLVILHLLALGCLAAWMSLVRAA